MKNENEIKRAFAKEVIDEIDKIRIGNSCCNNIMWSIKDRVQSLLPKEEEVEVPEHLKRLKRQLAQELKEHEETESDDVKDKELMDYTNWLFDDHDLEANKNILAKYKSIKSQQSLEQKARKKAEEMWSDKTFVTIDDVVIAALLIDPKTL
jgi:DNA-binding protein H-NS